MTVEEILEIVEEAFSDHVSAHTAETCLGTEVWMEGRDDFINQVREKLKEKLG